METYVYKWVPGCEIKLDVYRSGEAKGKRPVVVMIHGGALIMGARYPVAMDLCEALMAKACAGTARTRAWSARRRC